MYADDITPGAIREEGFWDFVCRNPDGSIAWEERVKNGATTVGLNDMLGTYFNSGTQITSWFAGLIDSAGFTSLSATDTASSHTGWTENQNYSAGTRPAWTPSTPSGASITSGSGFSFTINASITIKGAFMISNSTKGGTTGILFATGLFNSPQSLVNGQILSANYTCPMTAT